MQTIYWKVEASTKLHVEEDGEDMFAGKQIRFSQFEGDFESFGGRWVVEPSDDTTNPYKSVLRLELEEELIAAHNHYLCLARPRYNH